MLKSTLKYIIFTLYFVSQGYAQSGLYNFGNIQIHDQGAMGVHLDLINDGNFDQNLGMVGFYKIDNPLQISGLNTPIFNDIEIDVPNNLILNTSIGIQGELLFISGKISTPRIDLSTTVEYLDYILYQGESNDEFIDGYATSINTGQFIFPIGYGDEFRPMILPDQEINSSYSGAYFKESPNNPSTFSQNFDIDKMEVGLIAVNENEFWDLNGILETSIVLTWNESSHLKLMTSEIDFLAVVGWNKNKEIWEDLGQTDISGTFEKGTITSDVFVPDDYEIITIGVEKTAVLGLSDNIDYGISPNGDGMNDYLIIESVELNPENTLKIFNRWGRMVYMQQNYENTWNGIANNGYTAGDFLPVGVYFYTLSFKNGESPGHGYIYLNR